MPLVCLGLSHHTAPVEVREHHTVPAARLAEALVALCDYEEVEEAVMLSTCNRMEIYAELRDYEAGVEQLNAFVQNFRHGAVSDLQSYLYTLLGNAAVEHLLRVTTGLDSMLIGEAEIMGQVKSAYVSAQQAGTVGPTLHQLFRASLQAGKRARSRTRIGAASLSVPTAAVELARRHVGDLTQASVLVIGAGKMGQLAARRLHECRVREMFVANRTAQRAQELAISLGATRAISLSETAAVLPQVDVVITAAGAARFLITPEHLRNIRREAHARPLVLIDIAVPRDIDPDVAQLEGVQLIDIDALRDVVEDRLERRRAAIPLVEGLIAEYVERFSLWYRMRLAMPALAHVAEHAEQVRHEEIERLFARCPEFTARQRYLIIGASLRMFSRFLHQPFARIRARAARDLPAALALGRTFVQLFSPGRSSDELPEAKIEGRIVAPRSPINVRP